MIRGFTPFTLGSIRYDAPLIQAPLDGYSDSPFRRLTRSLGSPVSFTEFINGLDVVHKSTTLPNRIAFEEEERPIVFQLFDDEPQRIIDSAVILAERCHPDQFDINMGCSARRVANRGAGAGLLRHPEKIAAIVEGVVKRVSVPVSVKIRLGWDENSINFLEIGKLAQDLGASMVTLHARTREQQYSGHADWNAIAALKQALSIPVIGNGDVCSVADAQRMMDETGCDAIMVGRAGITNPWLFAGFDEGTVPEPLFRETCLKHLQYVKEFNGDNWGCVVFRKFAVRYLKQLGTEPERIRTLVTTDDSEKFTALFTELINTGYSGIS